ncbi:MAG: dihydroorotase [Treponema sp.]|nr:dihydroorotase [Treponema sp.]
MSKVVLIYNARLLDESMDTPGAVLVMDGKIRSVFQGYYTNSETLEKMARSVLAEDGLEEKTPLELHNAHGLTLTPAFIDMHVHLRYPGQTQKEDLNSGLHAAAAGGYGTIVAMPNTKPVVSSIEMAMKIEREAAAIGLTHLFQTVSLTKDFEGSDTSHLDFVEKKYVPVVSEDGRDVPTSDIMLEAMTKAAEKGLIVSCHSEDMTLGPTAKPFRSEALEIMKGVGLSAWGTGDEDFDPDDEENAEALNRIDLALTKANEILALAEDVATVRNIMLAKQADCHVHIAHVSTAVSMNAIREAKNELYDEEADYNADEADAAYQAFEEGEKYSPAPNPRTIGNGGFSISCEVTPHHLALCGTDEPYIRALVNPPLRSEDDRLALIEALRDGTADVISTDHAPHTADDKAGGAPGFTGLETAYAVCNSVLVKDNQFNPRRLSQLMSAAPARLLGLQKGLLRSGYDADLTIVDPDEEWVVDSSKFYSKGKATPFEGRTVTGKVKFLFIDGRLVFES